MKINSLDNIVHSKNSGMWMKWAIVFECLKMEWPELNRSRQNTTRWTHRTFDRLHCTHKYRSLMNIDNFLIVLHFVLLQRFFFVGCYFSFVLTENAFKQIKKVHRQCWLIQLIWTVKIATNLWNVFTRCVYCNEWTEPNRKHWKQI